LASSVFGVYIRETLKRKLEHNQARLSRLGELRGMEQRELIILGLLLVVFFLGRNAIVDTSEKENKIAENIGILIMIPAGGAVILVIAWGLFTSWWFWAGLALLIFGLINSGNPDNKFPH